MRAAIVTFPGSNCDYDCYKALTDVIGADAYFVWHREHDLKNPDMVILPGGFSYGDYLRAGAIARFSPIMTETIEFAKAGGLVMGICNGFQILCESHLLPGALVKNESLKFVGRSIHCRVENNSTAFTSEYRAGEVVNFHTAHGMGNYVADAATLDMLEAEKRIVFRYCDPQGNVTAASNPNGAANNIAGIINEAGNVLGVMPHPERSMEALLGSIDGVPLFQSLRRHVEQRASISTAGAA